MSRRKTKVAAAAAAAVAGKGVAGAQGRYDAAGTGRRIAAWNPPTSGPNRATDGVSRMRDRARDSVRNDWAGASGSQKWTTALVGVGVTPRWADERIGALWGKSVPELDADGTLDVYGMMALAVRGWFDAGEVFLRRRPRSVATTRLNVPIQFQLIESDYCPFFDAIVWPGMPTGNTIRQGIERNNYGERTAYWMFRQHPADGGPFNATPNPLDLIRVPASEISHIFEPKRPGQLRGASELAAVLVKLRSSMDFEDVVLDRQKLANLFTLFITRQLPTEFDSIEFDETTGLPKFYTDGTPLAGLEPGMAQELRPGEGVQFANPPEAGTTYSEYMRTSHMGTAAGLGVPYELFAGDLLNISDRTLRIAVNEFRRFAEQRQWHLVIPRICQPMVRWWAAAAVLAGALPTSKLDEASTPEWQPHGWPDIHPTQDVEGRIAARDAGFTSTSAVIARNGDDPRAVLAQRKADEASGLTPAPPVIEATPPAGLKKTSAPAPSPAKASLEASVAGLVALQAARDAAPAPAPQGPSAVESALAGMQAFIAQQQTSMSALMASFAEVTRALASRDTTVNVAAPNAPNVSITNDVKTPEVHNHVAAPEVHVDVAPPSVNVTNDVQPAAVTVDVNLPERRIESDITRNSLGDITKVIQTEKTVLN